MEKNDIFYIAYGSNMNHKQMADRCPGADFHGPGYVNDWILTMPSYANIEPRQGERVPVVVWRISSDHEKTLDHYERYPEMYIKKDLRVQLKNGEELRGMAYVMTPEYERKDQEIRPGYEEGILEAYRQCRFDREEYNPIRFR